MGLYTKKRERKMIDGVYVLSNYRSDFGKVLFSLEAPARNAHSWAHFAAIIDAYNMPMTNLLGIFSALSSASRPGCHHIHRDFGSFDTCSKPRFIVLPAF